MKKMLQKFLVVMLTVIISVFFAVPCFAADNSVQTEHPSILFISAYAYDWNSVPYQLEGINSVLGSVSQINYVFMDTKRFSYDDVKESVRDEVQKLIDTEGQYDTVILEDDAALDFALEYRNELFSGVPMVFMGINTTEKANQAHEDPLITGMIEFFPYNDTIALAKQLYPNATKILGISDDSESGKGCTKRFYDEKDNFPDLQFSDINTSQMTKQEIEDKLSSLDKSTILVFLSLVNDKDGNIYSLREATDFVNQHSPIPMFKADQLGIGEGVFGGYVSSYEEMGKSAANQVVQILSGVSPKDIPVDTMGGYPMFDQKQLDKYGVSDNMLPENSVIVNYVPSFYEQYRTVIWPAALIIAFLVLLIAFITVLGRKRTAEQKSKAQTAYIKLEEEKNKQLSITALQAEKANRSKSEFLARMSHEIRTPMNAIIGETTIAQKSMNSPAKVSECLSKVMISARHLLNLINDILDMSAIESSKIKIANTFFDLKEVVSTITTLYYSQCSAKGITFDSKLENIKYECLMGDQLRLQQIILNLLSNSLKFTESGGTITLFISETLADDKVSLHIVVKDTGCGMSEEYMTRIFKPFEQETALTAKEHGGSGLGLSISKNLVELMGGTISLKSAVNVGTEFTIEIPFIPSPEQHGQVKEGSITSMHAIVIDDQQEELEYVGSILSHIGISYDCASSGEEALNIVTKARNDKKMYDICLVDWKMTGMSGVELTKHIRAACGDNPIVIVASSYDVNEIRDDANVAGVDVCITKPLFQSTLFDILMNLSQGRLVNETADPKEYDFTGKRVLLVDDNEFNREIAEELLTMVGFQVDTANDGKQSVEVFEASETGTYDVILMDVQMPVMNGYDAAKAIRCSSHPQAKDICIIAMTANAFTEDIAASLSAGMNDHISKPIDTDLLYQVLARYLNI